MSASGLRTIGLTCVALAGFAANSLLCRKALLGRQIDAASFTTLRIAAGAAALWLLCRATSRADSSRTGGSVVSAAALFAYAIAFSIAYLRIGAGVGALVLFAAVQLTMIGWAIARGERPTRLEWVGLAIAAGGLVVLQVPGVTTSGASAFAAPDGRGVALMAGAGVAWGVYSLRGRRAGAPLAETAGNFVRAVPFALGASVLWLLLAREFHMTLEGALLAVISGSVTSGVCYSVWYAALPELGATRAAIVQLLVPALAAFGGVQFLGETLTLRVAASGAAILGGVALAILGRRRASS